MDGHLVLTLDFWLKPSTRREHLQNFEPLFLQWNFHVDLFTQWARLKKSTKNNITIHFTNSKYHLMIIFILKVDSVLLNQSSQDKWTTITCAALLTRDNIVRSCNQPLLEPKSSSFSLGASWSDWLSSISVIDHMFHIVFTLSSFCLALLAAIDKMRWVCPAYVYQLISASCSCVASLTVQNGNTLLSTVQFRHKPENLDISHRWGFRRKHCWEFRHKPHLRIQT